MCVDIWGYQPEVTLGFHSALGSQPCSFSLYNAVSLFVLFLLPLPVTEVIWGAAPTPPLLIPVGTCSVAGTMRGAGSRRVSHCWVKASAPRSTAHCNSRTGPSPPQGSWEVSPCHVPGGAARWTTGDPPVGPQCRLPVSSSCQGGPSKCHPEPSRHTAAQPHPRV